MHIDLTSKIAIVTGSTSGIGFAVARELAEAGATVVLNGPTQTLVDDALQRMITAVPAATVRGVFADLGSAAGAEKLIAAEPSADILINNLGIFGTADFFDVPDDEWHRFIDVNIMSGVRLSRAYLRGMADRRWGRVLFLASEAALNIPPDMIHYAVTKTALLALSRGLAKRIAGTGVTVNTVLPGPKLSEGLINMLKSEQEKSGKPLDAVAIDFIKAHRPSSIIQRPSTVDEVANMIVYLSSTLASATTGSALRVDGGVAESIL